MVQWRLKVIATNNLKLLILVKASRLSVDINYILQETVELIPGEKHMIISRGHKEKQQIDAITFVLIPNNMVHQIMIENSRPLSSGKK